MTKISGSPSSDDGLGPCPSHIGAELTPLWNELNGLIPDGVVVKTSDGPAFELLVRLTARIRSSKFTSAEASQARQLMDSFAMTPAARRRAGLDPIEPWKP